MNAAVSKGLIFLASRQDASGFWEDWELPVGSSRMWTTAYIGWRLASSGAVVTDSLKQAADWLEAHELEGGGWGYAESTGADADSTAFGILFLRAIGRRAPVTAVQRLLGFRRDDGGFATYGLDQSFGGWTASHVEVTAVAALALRATQVAEDVVEQAEAFLHRRRRADGLWDSYWWTSNLYATEMAVRLLGEPARQEACKAVREVQPGNSFEAALRGLILGGETEDLMRAQNSNGGWLAAPILRLAHRDISIPHIDAGPCFADPRRLFTTATVVSALRVAGRAIQA